jgi:hypothetical protein
MGVSDVVSAGDIWSGTELHDEVTNDSYTVSMVEQGKAVLVGPDVTTMPLTDMSVLIANNQLKVID